MGLNTKGFEVISSKHYWWINFVEKGRPIRQNGVGGLQAPRERERKRDVQTRVYCEGHRSIQNEGGRSVNVAVFSFE